jgi:hypothetical protein
MRWRIVVLSVVVVLMPAGGFAQAVATNFGELRLKAGPGDTLYITDTSGREFSSKVVDLSEKTLAVRVGGETRDLTEADVRRIRQRLPDRLWPSALIGFGVGAGLGALVAGFIECEGAECAGPSLGYGALGVGIGIGIDALIKGRKVIYEAPGTKPTRVALQPIVSGSVRGVRVTVPF